MPHDTHVLDGVNKDVGLDGLKAAKDFYLELAEGWEDPYGDPFVCRYGADGPWVIRDDVIVGTKARAGDLLISRFLDLADSIVYVQPRVGLAGVSILDVAKRYGKQVHLFMPASKRISHHQACCIERGAIPHFKRIAAMPNLNQAAEDWAFFSNSFFVPLGLRHELCTAALVKVASKLIEPNRVFCAISTGVLSRALQIAWPNAEFTCVAVARNLKAGEAGRASIISEPLDFQTPEKPENLPLFPTVNTYDGKVWKYVPKECRGERVYFWNVGAEPVLEDQTIYDRVDSNAGWDKDQPDEISSSDALYTDQ